MLKRNNIITALLFVAVMLLMQSAAFGQKKTCAFIGAGGEPDGHFKDSLLIPYLEQTYDLTLVAHDEVSGGTFTKADLAAFDFAFVSESAGTYHLKAAPDDFFKTPPVPMFFTELYASQSNVAGWISETGKFGATNDSTGVGGKVIIVDDTDHPLAAGFAKDAEVLVVDGTNDDTGLRMLTYCTPEVDYIPIAVYAGDPSLSVVFGIEPGTKLYDAAGLAVQDTLILFQRVAAVGVFAKANDSLTVDGYSLIDAGIEWILADPNAPGEEFRNTAITPQTSAFTATFNAVATADSVDGVIGLSKDLPDNYGDFAIKVIFANDGTIKASNGNGFEAAEEIAYSADTSYAIKIVGNVLEQDYSVWVDGILIGENNAFDPDPINVDSINYRSVKMSFDEEWGGNVGMVNISDFMVDYPNGDNINAAMEPQSENFMVKFDAKPTADLMDGVLGFSQDKPGTQWYYDSPVKLLFNNDGFVAARDSADFRAENEFAYTGGTTYNIRMVFDLPTQTYDAWIAPDGGEEVVIADDYDFDGVLDTVQWRTVVMSFGLPWGGAVGFVETTNFLISDVPSEDPEAFQNTEIPAQTSGFAALFHATPTADSIDGVVGFSQELPDIYGDYCIKLIFNNEGFIKANNGNDFEAASEMPYTGGTKYTVKIVGNILEQDYSIWINNEVLGYNFAFDPDPGVVDTIKYRSVKMSFDPQWGGAEGNVEIPLFMIDYPNEMNVTSPVEPQAENFSVTFDAKPTTDLIDGVIGFAQDRPGNTDWGQPVKLLFNNAGYITARDSGSFKTVDSLAYTGGNTYKIRMTFDFPSQTYDAWVDTEDGDVIIANDFHFDGVLDTVQWRTIIMSFGGAWGGAVGFVEITNFEISDSILTGIENGVMSLPENYALLQNYPNPFNPTTEISFSLTQAGFTSLSVYNAIGQEVARLIERDMAAGTHIVTFNAANLTSGVYFYRITTNNFTQVKKMMLMK